MQGQEPSDYCQLDPSIELVDFVDSYWESTNNTDESLKRTIFPDGFFKVVVILINKKIAIFFMTGLWPKETEIVLPAGSMVYGVKFKILVPEYILQREIASLLLSQTKLDSDFWDMNNFKLDSLQNFKSQIESILFKKLLEQKEIDAKKLHLSQVIYASRGNISAEEVANSIGWSNRQINRYLNKYIGMPLKAYLNIVKVYSAYIPIRDGNLYPAKGYHDQPHFIHEIKKHTSYTPKELHKQQNDRFIQLKHIQKK